MRAAWSDARQGDLRPGGGPPPDTRPLEAWVAAVTGGTEGSGPVREVYWMDQVHGTTVLSAGRPVAGGQVEPDGRAAARDACPVAAVSVGSADALVSTSPTASLAVLTADCAPLALGSAEGVFAAVHAGWRGLSGGVIERAVEAMRDRGATGVVGALGPCIHPGCYEFSEADLAPLVARYGDQVRGRTPGGAPALDLPAAVAAALAAAGADQGQGLDRCTACDGGFYSHRGRGDRGRQAMVVWDAGGTGAA